MRCVRFLGWLLGSMLLAGVIRSQAGATDLEPGVLETVKYLCTDVVQGAQPDPARLQPLLSYVREHPDAALGMPQYEKAPGAYRGYVAPQGLPQLMRYMYNPDIPQDVLKAFSLRSSLWTRLEPAGSLPALWTVNSPDMLVIRGEQLDRTTPDLSSGGCYAMKLDRTIIRLPEGVVSVSVQAEPSAYGTKGYEVGAEDGWRYVYSGETGLTRTGLGWVDSQVLTNISIGVSLQNGPDSTVCGVFQWMRAGWAGMSVVKQSHIRASLERYAVNMTRQLQTLPQPEALEVLHKEIAAKSDDQLRTEVTPVLNDWLAVAVKDGPAEAEGLLQNGYVKTLDRDELIGLAMRRRLE